MNTFQSFLDLKNKFPEGAWPGLLLALSQDENVWANLEDPDFLQRAYDAFSNSVDLWSPASLAMLGLDLPLSLDDMRSGEMPELPPEMQRRVVQAYQDWRAGKLAATDLGTVGLLALAVRENRRIKGSWKGLEKILAGEGSSLETLLACLYGMTPDPIDLVFALFGYGDLDRQAGLVLHAMLSNPMSEELMLEGFRALLEQLTETQSTAFLRLMQGQRPWLVPAIAGEMLDTLAENEGGKEKSSKVAGTDKETWHLKAYLTRLPGLLQRAEVQDLALQPAQSISSLDEALKISRRLQGHLAARMAGAMAGSDLGETAAPYKTSLDAWKQAVKLAPDEQIYAAGLASALLDADKVSKAQAIIEKYKLDENQAKDPAILIASARVGAAADDNEAALLSALKALELANGGAVLKKEEIFALIELFQTLDLPEKIGETLRAAVGLYPMDRGFRIKSAKIECDEGDYAHAFRDLSLAQAMSARNPEDTKAELSPDELDCLLVKCLEGLDRWEAALDERDRLIERQGNPSIEDWRSLANCAVRAGEPDRAVTACKQALEIDSMDGLTYGLLGDASLALGDTQTALEHYKQAVGNMPGQVDLWLALAGAHRQVGQDSQALDVLRAAVVALPKEPKIQLLLGETYLDSNSPTQALTYLRHAADQASTQRISLRLGQTLFQLGHFEEARQVLEKSYKENSEPDPQKPSSENGNLDNELAYAYARVLLALDDLQPAVPVLEAVIEACPGDPGPRLDLARVLLRIGDNSESMERVISMLTPLLEDKDQLEEDEPSRIDEIIVTLAEAQALLAEAYATTGKLSHSMDHYRKAMGTPLSHQPGWKARLSLGLGRVALKLDKPELAAEVLQNAVEAQPRDPEVHMALYQAYSASGRLENAFEAATVVRDLRPIDPDTLVWFANQSMELIRKPGGENLTSSREAIQVMRSAVQLAPIRGDLLVHLGNLYLEEGENQEALDTFIKLSEDEGLEKIGVGDYYQVARKLRGMQSDENAIALLNRAVGVGLLEGSTPGSTPDPQLVDVYAEMADIHHESGDTLTALQKLEEGITIDPKRRSLHILKADMLVESEAYGQAVDSLDQALILDSEDTGTHYRMARAARMLGDLPRALHHASRSLSDPDDPPGEISNRTANLLIADLAHSALRTRQARAYLGDDVPQDSPPAERFDYACLLAAVAMDEGDLQTASKAGKVIEQLDMDHPRSLAIRARLAKLSGDRETAESLFQALESSLDNQPSPKRLPRGARDEGRTIYRASCQAALAFFKWEQAFKWSCNGVDCELREPTDVFLQVQSVVSQAESLAHSRKLEILIHCPGDVALSEERFILFEEALQESDLKVEEIGILEGSDGVDLWGEDAIKAFNVWRARGMAVFKPDRVNADALQSALLETTPKSDDVAAMILAYFRINEPVLAVNITRTEWPILNSDPLVMSRLALALENVDARQGLDLAGAALEMTLKGACVSCPPPPHMHYLVARLAYKVGERHVALGAIKEALDWWDDEPRWHALAGSILQASSKDPEYASKALIHFEKAASLEPQEFGHHMALGHVYQVVGEQQRAVKALEQAANLAGDQVDSWLVLAQAQNVSGDVIGAAASAERAVELAPESVEALLMSADVAVRAGNPEVTLSHSQKVLEDQPDHPQALYYSAKALKSLDQPGEALEKLDKALPLLDNPLPMQLERIYLLREVESLEAAIVQLKELAIEYPGEPELLATLSEWLLQTGESETAVQTARAALAADQGDLSPQKLASLNCLIGIQMRRSGQLDQAVHHFSEAAQQDPNNADAYLELGRVLQDRRQQKQALRSYRKAIQASTDDFRPYYYAGQVLKDLKEYLEAEKMLRRAAQLAPTEVSVHRLLGAVVALNLVHNRKMTAADD